MFCTACGRPAIGNFCTACGKPLVPRKSAPAPHFPAAAQMVRTATPVAQAGQLEASGPRHPDVALRQTAPAELEQLPELEEAPPLAVDTSTPLGLIPQSRGDARVELSHHVSPPRRPGSPPALPARRLSELEVTFLPDDAPQPWDEEVNYRTLVKTPEVRELIDRYAGLSRKKMSGEELLQLAEKIMPTGVPLDKVMSLFQPLATQMGIGTGQERVERIQAPVGRVLVRALCSLARHGQSLRHIRQGSDGCALEATLPSDIWALEGQLGITVVRRGGWTDVGAATKVGGQWFDWGKSRRCLDQLFADLQHDPY